MAEDQYREGGVASAVLEALARSGRLPRVAHLAVRHLPGSGGPAELLDAAGIGATAIADGARRLLGAA